MTTSLREAVRKACDTAWTHTKCVWPDCSCLFDGSGEIFLTALIDQARAEEREKVAAFMGKHSLATGHGDTTEDLLGEMEWQIAELRAGKGVGQ